MYHVGQRNRHGPFCFANSAADSVYSDENVATGVEGGLAADRGAEYSIGRPPTGEGSAGHWRRLMERTERRKSTRCNFK